MKLDPRAGALVMPYTQHGAARRAGRGTTLHVFANTHTGNTPFLSALSHHRASPHTRLKSCLQRPAFENGQLPAAPRPRSNRQHKDAQLGRPGVQHVPHTTPSASVRVARNPRLGGSRRRRPPPANPPLQCSPSRGPGGWASPSVHLGHLLRLRRVLQALGISRYLSASLGTLAISRYSRHLRRFSASLGVSRHLLVYLSMSRCISASLGASYGVSRISRNLSAYISPASRPAGSA